MILEAKIATQKYWLAVILLLELVSSCKSDNPAYTQLRGNAQGTTFSIIYEPVSSADYIQSVDSLLLVIDKSMSLWDTNSVIVNVNRQEEKAIVDAHFINVFKRSQYFYELSRGAFDPSLEPLIEAWGFARKHSDGIPPDRVIDSLLNFVGLENFTLERNTLRKKIPQAEINFNAIAQGYTVDVLSAFLESHGILNYMVELGGEILAKGINQFGEPWKLGIDRPDFNNSGSINAIKTVVGLSNAALVTSGSYRKFVEKDGKKYSHTLDPKTGKSVSHNLLSVSVIAPTAMDADAYATMFMVIGKDSAINFAERNGLKIQCIYDEQGNMKVEYSKGFEELVIQEN